MEDIDINEILKIILSKIKGKRVIWRLEGSANLKLQGVPVSVHDLDIATNTEGIAVFREVLKEYIKKTKGHHTLKGVVCGRPLFLGCSEIKHQSHPLTKVSGLISDIMKDSYREDILSEVLLLRIDDFEVEILNRQPDIKELNMFEKIRIITWRGLKISSLSLEDALEFYRIIQRDDKVKIIEEYLKKKSKLG